ncbi:hypothetical protein FRC00_007243 [Tulasnella sp. 408]|nr:hypothetical protein FRC00_007243 [Tulasnella sp. 408]
MNPNTLRIISIVQARVDAFLKDIFDIYKSSEDDPTIKTPANALATKTAICDAVEVVVRRQRNEFSLFSRLDLDVVHSIFGAALDVDLVHDPGWVPLENLNQHRRQLFRMRRVSTSWNKFLLSSPRYWHVIDIKSPSGVISAAIERSGSSPLSLLGTRTPALRTLELMGATIEADDFIEPLGDLSPIRNLAASWWQPPSDAVWLTGLRELTLADLPRLNMETFLVISACTSLETLNVRWGYGGIVDDLSDVPSLITLPHLQVMNLSFKSDELAVNIIRRLFTPHCLRASLEITLPTGPLDQHVMDYCKFMSPREKCYQYPSSATILINNPYLDRLSLTYQTESCRIAFGEFDPEEAPAFHNLVQKFQTSLKEPPLTDAILSAIGESLADELADAPESTTITWPFESLKFLTIYDVDLNVSQITWLVGIRQQYLRENSKSWLEEIVLKNCQLKGMRLAKAAKQLAAIGVTLRGVQCSRM